MGTPRCLNLIPLIWLMLVIESRTENEVYTARDIQVWTYDRIPQQDVSYNPTDNSFHVNTQLNITLGYDTLLTNVKISAVVIMSSDRRRVIDIANSSYEPQSLKFPSNTVTEPRSIHKITEELRPQLDELLIDELNRNFREKRSASQDVYNLKVPLYEIVDDLISVCSQNVSNILPLADLDVTFTQGRLTASGGWMKGLKTAFRTDEPILKVTTESFQLSGFVGLEMLRFGFSNYLYDLRYWSYHGLVNGSVCQTSATVKITMTPTEDKCTTVLDYVTINQLDGIWIKLSNLGLSGDRIMKDIYAETDRQKPDLISAANTALTTFLTNILATYDCGKFFKKLNYQDIVG